MDIDFGNFPLEVGEPFLGEEAKQRPTFIFGSIYQKKTI
jgi:hypothetical protein